MQARDAQAVAQRTHRRAHPHRPGLARPHGGGAVHIGPFQVIGLLVLDGKTHVSACAGHPQPQQAEDIVRREHGHAVGPQGCNHRAVLLRHRLRVGHELQVLALRVVHQRHRGPCHVGQRLDFTGVVHAQLHHRHLVLCIQAQQGQRHANVVVEVALRGQHGLRLEGAQNRRHHLCDRGLAVTARHSDQGQLELRAPACGQLAQGVFAISHHQTGQTGASQSGVRCITLAQGGYGALGLGLGQVVVAVKALALECHEEVARHQAAGVGVHTLHGDAGITNDLRAGDPLCCLLQGHHC